jgi:hypothetical protein
MVKYKKKKIIIIIKWGKSLWQRLSRAGGDDECSMIAHTHTHL